MKETEMKKIAFVVVWIGKLPEHFGLWIKSCGWNPTIDFYVFTDDTGKYEMPENVKKIYMSFEELKDRFQRNFHFQINLERAYKMCDYKPAYGETFKDYLLGYDYWGYCDMDLIWGDIRAFVTDEILEQNDRIFTRGHCSLFRNTSQVNSYYRTLPANGHLDYHKVYTTEETMCFDEWGEHCGGGISVIFKEHEIPTYDEPVMADIYVQSGRFIVNRRKDLQPVERFVFKQGKLKAYVKGKKEPTDVLYCHFQKRKVSVEDGLEDMFQFLPPADFCNISVNAKSFHYVYKVAKYDVVCKLKRIKGAFGYVIRRNKR